MNRTKRLLTLLLLAAGFTTGAWADLTPAADDWYELATVQDWQDFATLVETTPAANARMTADIDLGDDQTMIGTSSAKYQGTLDGQGHTLTINYTTTENYYAPFRYIQGAKIKNLHVAGTIHTSHRFTGGLVGESYGTSNIENCRSSVELISSYSGDAVHSGFVASIGGGTLNIKDCLFDGILTGSSAWTWGGFVGWKYSYTANINNCLFIPESVNVGAQYSATFSGNGGTVENSYYTVCLNNSTQGTQATTAQLADGTTAYKLQAFRDQLIWGQRIGTDDKPVLTTDEICRVYRSENGGYTNDSDLKYTLKQDGEGYYLLGSLFDWLDFAIQAELTPNAKARMTADIDLGDDQTMIGTSNVPYQGTFDGQGHKLTVNYNVTKDYAAPFHYISGASIRKLRVYGSIDTTRGYAGGVVGCILSGNSYISQCVSAVTITSTRGSEEYIGGFVGEATYVTGSTTININDCLCQTVINAQKAANFIGYVRSSNWYESHAYVYNSLSTATCPNALTSIYNWNDAHGESAAGQVTNTYIVNRTDGAEGTQVTAAQLADGRTAYKLQKKREDLVWGQRIGTDDKPVLTTDESYRVYRSKNGGYTNDSDLKYTDGLMQDGEDYYLLGSLFDWQDFATLVETMPTAKARLTADIDLGDDQTMIGSESTPYQGTFDGQGHSLTMAYNVTSSSSEYVAPFVKIQNATIQNLHVKGSIITAGVRPAGITSFVTGTSYIRNCWSEVAIVSSKGSWIDGGSFVGRIDYNNTLNMDDCVFTGSITLSNSDGYEMGGFVGWTQNNGIANVQNCLFAPSGVTSTKTNNYMLVHGYQNKVTITNCYYRHVGSTSNWVAQGTETTSTNLSNGTTTSDLGNNWVQDPLTNQPMLALFAGKYKMPSSGLATFSAKANFTMPEGLEAYYCKNYDASEGAISVVPIEGVVPANTGILLRGTAGETYTLTISNETPATVEDNALVAVTDQTTIQQTDGDYTNFGLSGGEFKMVNSAGGTVKANRAYLRILTSDLSQSQSTARGITIDWDDETTAIGKEAIVKGAESTPGQWYTIGGRKLAGQPTQKGIYIVNGKKVVIK